MDLSEAVLQKVQFISMSVTEMAQGRVLRMLAYQWDRPSQVSAIVRMASASGFRLPELSTSRLAVLSPAPTVRAYCSIFFRGRNRLTINSEPIPARSATATRPGNKAAARSGPGRASPRQMRPLMYNAVQARIRPKIWTMTIVVLRVKRIQIPSSAGQQVTRD